MPIIYTVIAVIVVIGLVGITARALSNEVWDWFWERM